MKTRHSFIILCVALTAFLFCSCVKETNRGDSFQAEFKLNTEQFFDGETVQFTIKCNRSSIKVIDFDFKLAPRMVSVNETYTVRDGEWSPSMKVSVPESQRGKLHITIQDPVTKATREFTASYTAYQSSRNTLFIENKPVSSSRKIPSTYPLIVDGDDFQFTLRSESQNLVLTDFECEFNDGTLYDGKEFNFENSRRQSFSIPSVKVDGDEFEEPFLFSMTLHNPETGRDTTVKAHYLTAIPLTPSVVLEPANLRTGERAVIKISGNRDSFLLTGYNAPQWFSLNLSGSNYECNPGLAGYTSLFTDELTIPANESGQLTFIFKDSYYTEREVQVSVPYKAAKPTAPSNIQIDKTSAVIAEGETLVFNVSTSDTYSTGRFNAFLPSGVKAGALKFYVPQSESEDPKTVKDDNFVESIEFGSGKLFVRGFDKGGQSSFRVSAAGNEKVYKDVDVFVKYSVALVIDGEFEDWMETKPYTNLDHVFSKWLEDRTDAGVGWFGFPVKDMTAELMTYSYSKGRDLSGMSEADAQYSLSLSTPSYRSSTRTAISFTVTAGDGFAGATAIYDLRYEKAVKSNCLYGRAIMNPHMCLNGTYDPRYFLHVDRIVSGHITNEPQSPSSYSSTYPKVLDFVNTVTDASPGTAVTLKELTLIMKKLDCNARVESGHDKIDVHDAPQIYSFISIDINNVVYDTSVYDLKYIIHRYKIPGKHGPVERWWKEIDKSSDILEAYRPD